MREVLRGQGLGAEIGLVHVLCSDWISIDFQRTFVSRRFYLCQWYESVAWRRLISYNLDIVNCYATYLSHRDDDLVG